jgi:phage-related minor tail protein
MSRGECTVALILGELASILTLDDSKFRPEEAVKRLEATGAPADKAGQKVGEKFTRAAGEGIKDLPKDTAKTVTRAGEESAAPARKAGEHIGDKINEGTKEQLDGLKAIAGTAIAGIGIGEAVSGLLERSNVGGKVAAQLGSREAKQTAAEAGKEAGEIYAENYGDNLDQIGEAIVALNQNLPHIGDDLSISDPQYKKLTEQLLTITSVFGQEIPDVTRAAGKLISTGLVKDAGEAFDLITVGFQQGANSSDDLLESLNEYPTQFRDLGISGADAVGLIRQVLRGGARDSDVVADALKELNLRIQGLSATPALKKLGLDANAMAEAFGHGGKKARDALAELMRRLQAVKDPAERFRLAQQLLGTQSEDLGKALFSLNLDTAAQGLGYLAGATDRAGSAMSDTAGSKLDTFKRQLQINVVNFLGDKVIPKLQEWGQVGERDVLPVLKKIGDFVQQNADVLIPLVAGILAAIVAFKGITLAVNTFNAILTANPIVLLVVAILALGVALVVAYQKSETFRKFVHKAFTVVKVPIEAVATAIRAVVGLFQTVVGWVGKLAGPLSKIGGFFQDLAGHIFNAVSRLRDFTAGAIILIPLGQKVLDTVAALSPHGTGAAIGGRAGNRDSVQLAAGGIVKAKPGGTLALLAEAGQDEAVIPISKLPMLRTDGGITAAGGSVPTTAGGAPDMEAIRRAVEDGAYAGTSRAFKDGRLRLERRSSEVIASIANAGNQSLAGLR